MMTEILKTLVLPCGLVWLGLIAVTFLAWRSKRRVLFGSVVVLLVAYTALGNPWLGRAIISRQDGQFAHIRSLEKGPYDVVIVLGGGTFTGAHGQVQLSLAGDRVMLGARMYLKGRTQMLVSTGISTRPDGQHPADECSQVWQDLGIPADDIIRLGGANTAAEMDAIRVAIDRHGWKRVGLVTSSWHMQRALALAKARELNLDPLPASVSGRKPTFRLPDMIPHAKGFTVNTIAMREILGAVLR